MIHFGFCSAVCGYLESGRLRSSTNTRRNKECASTGTRCERYELSNTWLSTNRRKDSLKAKSIPSCTKPQAKATKNPSDLHTSSGGRRITMRLNATRMLSGKIWETIDSRFRYPPGSRLSLCETSLQACGTEFNDWGGKQHSSSRKWSGLAIRNQPDLAMALALPYIVSRKGAVRKFGRRARRVGVSRFCKARHHHHHRSQSSHHTHTQQHPRFRGLEDVF